ncbi:putative ribonuclease H-like domain-containing protein [Tanacetum coccineum]
MAEQDTPPPTITAMKIPIIRKGEYDIWSMRMRQYICHTDHNLWDVIVNGDLEEEPAPTGETSAPPAPKTAKQLAAKRNQERVKSILLLAIPDEYLLKFHNVADAKSLWEAIKSRFGGNEESKKMQKNVLKHQFENFTTASNESLDKAYDRFQKLISQLEVHGAPISKEDINQKFLRSLPPSWNQIALIMRNKPDIDEIDIDDLYNNLRTTNPPLDNEDLQQIDQDDLEELDIRWQVAMLTVRVQRFMQKTRRNLDFKGKQHVTFDKSKVECYNYHRKGHFAKECKSGRNQGKRSYGDNGRRNATTNEPSSQALVAQDGLGGYDWSNDFDEPVNYALMAISSSSSSSSSDNEGYELALESLESRILGHEKNELAWGKKYEFQNYELKCREVKIDNLKMELEKVVKERDELKDMAHKASMSNKSKTDSEISMSVFEVRSSDEEITPANDRFSKADGYHVVPPPITGNFLTPRADISFAGLDEYAIRKKIIESKTDTSKSKTSETVGKTNEVNIEKPKSVHESVVPKPKINRDKVIIEDWNSDDEDDVSAVKKTVSPVKTIETQTVRNRVDKIGQISQKEWIGFKKIKGNPETILQDHAVVDSGCSSHMTSNSLSFRTIKDYIGGLFKLLDESQVVLRAPRQNGVYSLDLKNIVPSGGITCLYANATTDESKLWHRRLSHVNFKNLNKLVKGYLVRGLPSKVFVNDHTCVACKKGKQHKASCKAKLARTIRKPLELLHMNLFGSVLVESINKKKFQISSDEVISMGVLMVLANLALR